MGKKLFYEQIWSILIYALTMAFSGWLLLAYNMGMQGFLFFEGCLLACGIACFLLYFLPRYRFYREAYQKEQELKEKHMLYDVLEPPGFAEGNALCDLLEAAGQAMQQRIASYELDSREYREYVETWVHEIKTPIASGQLIAENNPSKAMEVMACELLKIDSYVEQALYYARSSSAEQDYLVRKYQLKELVRGALRSRARMLILRGIAVQLERLDFQVYTDSKWMGFMIGQVLENSSKYGAKHLHIWAEKRQENIVLHIEDDGVGVDEQDIGRIFEKGFTGKNGRAYGKSTGIGLYLCRKLADKLGMGIFAHSCQEGGLCINFVFPTGSLTEM